MTAPRLITLDLDDTLWPVVPTLVAAEAALYQWLSEQAPATTARFDAATLRDIRTALARERQDLVHDMNWLRTESIRRALVNAGDDPALADQAFAVFYAARQRVRFFADVLPVLERWSRQVPLVAISNGNADVEAVGLGHLFSAAISAHEIGFAKPDPRTFALACEKTGVSPDQVLHIGDDLEADIRGARAAGMQAAWLRRPELGNAAVDRLVLTSGEKVWPDLTSIDRAFVLHDGDRRPSQTSGKPN